MSNETAHFLNYCPVILEYIQLGKASRNTQNNMVMLGNGDPIPFDPANRPWAARLTSTMPGTCTCFLKKIFRQIFRQTCSKFVARMLQKRENSNPFAHLASINEDEEVLGSLGEENPEEAELGRYIEVLQARKNEMVSGKKLKDLPMPVLPNMDQLKEVFSAERMYQPLRPNLFQAPLHHQLMPCTDLSQFVPPAKSQSIDHYSGDIRRDLTDSLGLTDPTAAVMTDLTPRVVPIAFQVEARARVGC